VPDSLVAAATLASLDDAGLSAALRPIWEDAGLLVVRLRGRPFGSWAAVIDAAEQEIAGMSDAERVALLRAHPRLGEEPEVLRARSSESWAEQGAGASPDQRLAELNDRYEERFGFPFVEWVAGRPLSAMVPVIESRMQRRRADELEAGCAALVAIARDRLGRLERVNAV
jgi:2-oxo-4-hydroxy-4-carboxy--5-ureidoimidazoline (OHCU) decarboxylase